MEEKEETTEEKENDNDDDLAVFVTYLYYPTGTHSAWKKTKGGTYYILNNIK